MAKKLDTYQMWEKTGVLKSKLDYIKAASATFYTQKEMCRDLGITEQTFTQLKNKHPEIQQAISEGEALLLNDLFSALKRKAVGYKEKTTSKAMRKTTLRNTCMNIWIKRMNQRSGLTLLLLVQTMIRRINSYERFNNRCWTKSQ